MIWWCKQKNKPCSMANENGYCQITACCKTLEPTVKAIPIEWIEKYAKRTSKKCCHCATAIWEMLDDWEKENE